MLRYFSIKQILLTGITIFILAFIAHLKIYSDWNEKLSYFWDFYEENKDNTEIEQRKQYYGASYFVSKQIRDYLVKSKELKGAIVVFPPPGYFRQNNVGFSPPEPSVFYYYTGVRSVWMNNPTAPTKATHWIDISGNGMRIVRIQSPAQYDSLTTPFKKYDY